MVKKVIRVSKKHQVGIEDPFFNRYGGYYSILDKESGKIIYSFLVGRVPINKMSKYMRYSQEKAVRLYKNLRNMHITSLESRNEEKKQYEGAINGRRFIHSFSGYQEKGDSFISLAGACFCGDMNSDLAHKIMWLTKTADLIDRFEIVFWK